MLRQIARCDIVSSNQNQEEKSYVNLTVKLRSFFLSDDKWVPGPVTDFGHQLVSVSWSDEAILSLYACSRNIESKVKCDDIKFFACSVIQWEIKNFLMQLKAKAI